MKAPEQTTDLLAERIIAKEMETFDFKQLDQSPVKRRIADNNTPALLQDFNLRHHLYFYPVESKTFLDVMVSDVREIVKEKRVTASPKCQQLIGCMRNGVWVKLKSGQRGKEFSRSKAFGHYDGFAAAMYFIREADLRTNPLPVDYKGDLENTFVPKQLLDAQKSSAAEIIGAGMDAAMQQEFNFREHNESYD